MNATSKISSIKRTTGTAVVTDGVHDAIRVRSLFVSKLSHRASHLFNYAVVHAYHNDLDLEAVSNGTHSSTYLTHVFRPFPSKNCDGRWNGSVHTDVLDLFENELSWPSPANGPSSVPGYARHAKYAVDRYATNAMNHLNNLDTFIRYTIETHCLMNGISYSKN